MSMPIFCPFLRLSQFVHRINCNSWPKLLSYSRKYLNYRPNQRCYFQNYHTSFVKNTFIKDNKSFLVEKHLVSNSSLLLNKSFHTTRPNQVPAIVIQILRPIGKFVAIIVGRKIRSWYRNLPPNKKRMFKDWIIRNKVLLAGIISALSLGIAGFYYTHLEETPITGRRRFVIFNDKQFKNMAKFEFETLLANFQDVLLPISHPFCRRVERVAMRLINANMDLPQISSRTWKITVINAPKVKNAFVTPNGQIFVFSGMLDLCSNDDQLGLVLAHEVSHTLMQHSAEMLSYTSFIDLFVMALIAAIWAIIPSDFVALGVHFILEKLLSLTTRLPYSRKLETEADEVGLNLAAKACFDVREAVAFWKKMHFYETLELGLPPDVDIIKDIDFLSGHPSHAARAENLQSLLPQAIALRDECKCPRLPRLDPIVMLERERDLYARTLEAEKLKNVIVIDVSPMKPRS